MPGKQSADRRRQLWLLAREGQARRAPVAEVALLVPGMRTYTFAVPEHLANRVSTGAAVIAPYGRANRPTAGYCLRVSSAAFDQTRKELLDVDNEQAPLAPAVVDLGRWISTYYHHPPGRTLAHIAPAGLRKVPMRTVKVLSAAGHPDDALTSKQRALLETLLAAGPMPRDEALRRAGVGAGVLRKLESAGRVHVEPRRVPRRTASAPDKPVEAPASPEDDFALTQHQSAAINAVSAAVTAAAFRAFLLFGVPGSGKTEVYVRAIRAAHAAGKQAILIVPEITLATQIVQRLARRFARAAVLHSRLTTTQRRDTHHAIAAGNVDLVIGTRTAVFAPCPSLGLIVVDEEQESSLKNLQAPYYHARDVALRRGQLESLPVLLGSATPSLETWHNAAHLPHYRRLTLPERIARGNQPHVHVAGAIAAPADHRFRLLSDELLGELRRTVEQQRQAVILHNRRGSAAFLACEDCGLVVRCDRCGAHLVEHRLENLAKCHRCGRKRDIPRHCLDDSCRGRLARTGRAIQAIQEEIRRALPEARILRVDADTMKSRDDYAAALREFEQGTADILLGTQMVAKGLDFPTVRLVGVTEADAPEWLPDFRAAEHGFQLLMQVIGRAGRGTGDSVALIQCHNPHDRLIQTALQCDYPRFADSELELRRRLFDPPYARLIRFVCADGDAAKARRRAEELAADLRQLAKRIDARIRVDDAAPCVISRRRDMFRYELLARLPRQRTAPDLLQHAEDEKLLYRRVKRMTIDVDPIDML